MHGKDTRVWAVQGYVAMGSAGILCCALQEYSAVAGGDCRDAWWLVKHCKALRGYLVVGHCRDAWWLGTAGILSGWALRDTWWLGTAEILCG